jgi:galactokinase
LLPLATTSSFAASCSIRPSVPTTAGSSSQAALKDKLAYAAQQGCFAASAIATLHRAALRHGRQPAARSALR